MLANKLFKNSIFTIAIFSIIFTAFATDAAAQCGGVYFKRTTGSIAATPNTGFHLAEDVTGDGVPDLLGTGAQTLSDGYKKIVILPANGTGGFGSQIVITTPARIASYTTGDFDTDGKKDIVVLLETAPQSILVYKNNGNGTFTPQTQMIATTHGMPYLFLDINGDGKGDYIGFSPNNSVYRYSLGNGDGTFGTPVEIFQGAGHFVAGDFSGDGKVDFIAGDAMLINNGNGIFKIAPAGFTLSQYENIRHVKDFNGDGKLDLATTTQNPSAFKVSVLLNNGNNTFSRTDYPITENQQSGAWYGDLLVGNFSGNGALDLLYRPHVSTNMTVVYTNNGSGVFTKQDYNYSGKGIFTGDFDGDGKTDIVHTTVSSVYKESVAVVYKNVCDQPGQTEIVDFNRDGQTDKTYWNPLNGNWTYKTSEYAPVTTVNWGLGSLGDIPMPGDYDKDGITDIAVFRNSTGVWYIRQSSNLAWYVIQWGVSGDKPVSQDYDGDGFTDIAVWRPSDGNWYVWHMGTQTYSIFHWGANGDRPAPEDYDGDGKTDFAVFRPNTGEWFILRSSDATWTYTIFGIGDDELVPADYDGDGKAEIAAFRPSVGIWFMKRTPEASSYTSFFFGQNIDRPQPGDYNGDGVFDAAIYRPSTASWYTTLNNEQDIFGVGGAIATSSILRVPQ